MLTVNRRLEKTNAIRPSSHFVVAPGNISSVLGSSVETNPFLIGLEMTSSHGSVL